MKRALLVVDAGNVGEVLAARKDEMLMAGQDHVDAVDLGEMERGILLPALTLAAGDTGMAQRHDDVGTGLPEVGHVPLRRLDDVRRRRLAVEIGLVPLHDLRRHEADDADLDRLHRAALVLEGTVEDDPGPIERHALRA